MLVKTYLSTPNQFDSGNNYLSNEINGGNGNGKGNGNMKGAEWGGKGNDRRRGNRVGRGRQDGGWLEASPLDRGPYRGEYRDDHGWGGEAPFCSSDLYKFTMPFVFFIATLFMFFQPILSKLKG